MSNISILSALISGVQRNVDLSVNTLVVDTLKVGGPSGTDLTKTVLDGLIAGTGASTALDNLTTTSINQDLNPATDATESLGTSTKRWIAVNAQNVNASDISTTGMAASGSVSSLNMDVNGTLVVLGAATMHAGLDMSSTSITNVVNPTAAQDAATKDYVDTAVGGAGTGDWKADGSVTATGDFDLGGKKIVNIAAIADAASATAINLASNTLVDTTNASASVNWGNRVLVDSTGADAFGWNGGLDAKNNKIQSVGVPSAGTDAANKDYADLMLPLGGGTMSGPINMNGMILSGLLDPGTDYEAATKHYVDTSISAIPATDVTALIHKDGSVAFTADQPMGSNKLTGLAAATANGDAVRFEQAVLADGSHAITGNQSFSSTAKITNLLDPTAAQDGATKAYVDNAIAGLSWKQAAVAASVANVSVSSAPATIDGHTLVAGERVLLKDQTAPAENGIYVFSAAASPLVRASDADTWNEIVGFVIYVESGTANGGSKWVDTNVAGGTINTTAITITLFAAASALDGVGTTGYNSYWTAAHTLAAEQYVAAVRGGLATDASAFTGVVKASSGVFSAATIVNTDIDAAAAIGLTKLAPVTANKALISSGGGVITDSTTTATELGYVTGVTSAIQTQLGTKAPLDSPALTGVPTAPTASPGANSTQLATTAYVDSALTGISSETLSATATVGEAFAITTLRAVRYAKAADAGFTAGRVYKADNDATSADNFYTIGLVLPAGALTAGQTTTMVKRGLITATAHGFTVGAPIYLGAAGALTNTAPSTTALAVVRVGIAKDANTIDVDVQVVGVN